MGEGISAGPTHVLRMLAGLAGIASIFAALFIWGSLAIVQVPPQPGASHRTNREVNFPAVAMGVGVMLGGLLVSTSCFVLASMSDNVAAMREEEDQDE